MNNEPVAWMWYQSKENTNPYTQMTGYSYLCFSEFKPDENVKVDEGTLIPLYTHPAELTDEEIQEVIRKHWNKEYGNRNMLSLCKAVLKEAKK